MSRSPSAVTMDDSSRVTTRVRVRTSTEKPFNCSAIHCPSVSRAVVRRNGRSCRMTVFRPLGLYTAISL